MNAELKDKLSKVITKNPGALQMRSWVSDCGTACCIAGWTLVLCGRIKDPLEARGLDVFHIAIAELGITKNQGERLFYTAEWPHELRVRYYCGDKTAAVDMLNLIHEEGLKMSPSFPSSAKVIQTAEVALAVKNE